MKKVQKIDRFNFFVPCEIEKAKKGDEDTVTHIKGIASSAVADSDEEILLPEGFDFKPFLQKGILNYNHQSGKTSAAIVGQPTHGEVVNQGKDFYIEGIIYPNDEGKSIVKQARIFEKYSPDRRFGFSIEGRAIERDPLNPKRITKAVITGCAITIMPKNPNTLMDIVKGEYVDAFQEGDDVEDDENTEKSMGVNVDLNPESVEGGKNKLKNVADANTYVKKSIIFEQICTKYSINDFAKAKSIYNFVLTVNEKIYSMQENKVSQEAITKAFSILDNIVKGEETETPTQEGAETIEKKEEATTEKSEGAATAEAGADENKEQKELVKSILAKGENGDQAIAHLIIGGASLDKAQEIVKSVEDEIAKGDEGTQFATLKSFDFSAEFAKVLAPIQKSIGDSNSSLKEGLGAMAEIMKGINDENQVLKSELNEVKGVLEKIGNASQGRKSVTSNVQALSRFAKSEDGGGAGNAAAANTFNINNKEDRSSLGEAMLAQYHIIKGQGKENDLLYKSIADLEISKSLPSEILPQLNAWGLKVVSE